MTAVWICEKPSQANEVAAALGITRKGQGVIHTQQGVVTWASGHLFEQFEPDDYDPAHKAWRLDALPIVPDRWRIRALSSRAAQLRIVVEAIKAASLVVIATDADREGESIGREILEHAKYRGPTKRLWISALDPESIKRAVKSLRPGESTEPLYWAALARSRADWLVGMNLTRAATIIAQKAGAQGVRSVGRVQTPTLALVVRRDRDIANFVSRAFFEIEADVDAGGQAVVLRHAPAEADRIYDRAEADVIAQRVIGAEGPVTVKTERKRRAPPKLLSLAGLQKICSKRFGFAADKTLSVAQSLYEDHKVLSYPRSDCAYMPTEQEGDVPAILAHLSKLDTVGGAAEKAADAPIIRKSVFDTAKITAHHAIVPTLVPARMDALSPDERRVYLLVAQHYVAAMSPDYVYDETRISMTANGIALGAVGSTPVTLGWKVAMGTHADDDDNDKSPTLPVVANGAHGHVTTARVDGKQTKAPSPYTEGTLIEDMNSIAKFCDDPQVAKRLRETSGIGTSATQGATIKGLRDRGFLAPSGKNAIVSTESGRALIDFLPRELCDPAITGLWEDRLKDIAEGSLPEKSRDEFVDRVVAQVQRLLDVMRSAPPPDMSGGAGAGHGSRSAGPRTSGRGAARSDAPNGGGDGASRTPFSRRDGVPTPKMLQYAESIATSRGLKHPPAAIKGSFDACKKWIDENGGELAQQRESGKPSRAQLDYATKIANTMRMALPAACYDDRAECSRFIDVHSRTGSPSMGRR